MAAAAGAPRSPAWYYNLAANPDHVRIEIPGQTVAVIAELLHGADGDHAWQQIVAAARQFGKYEQHTDREMPVIRLRRK